MPDVGVVNTEICFSRLPGQFGFWLVCIFDKCSRLVYFF